MDFRLTEEQELLLENLREVIGRESSEDYIKECTEKNVPPVKVMKALMDSGFCTLGIPEEYGGTPVDTLTLMLFTEELCRLTAASFPTTMNILSIDDILTFGSEEQKELILSLYMETGDLPFALGITEPQAGSDNSALATSATHKDGKVYINGHKSFITSAMEAPYLLCLAREDDAVDPKNAISMYLVPMDAPGVKREQLHKIGQKLSSCCEVYLDNVEIEEKDLVGTKGNGFKQLMKNFEIERLTIAAKALGQAQVAFEDAAAYANQRVQFGQKIGQFQLIQEKLTEMQIKLTNMRNYVYKTAWEKDNGISIRTSSALAKYYSSRAAFEVIDDAMQILGGIGYTTEHRVTRLWQDARMYRIGGGTDQIMIHVAGRQILKQHS